MTVEVEFFTITGLIGYGETGMLILKEPPTTGPNGAYDIAIDPTDGPAQRQGPDFGVTHLDAAGATAAVAFDLSTSDIRDVLVNTYHGVTAPLTIRALYNY